MDTAASPKENLNFLAEFHPPRSLHCFQWKTIDKQLIKRPFLRKMEDMLMLRARREEIEMKGMAICQDMFGDL